MQTINNTLFSLALCFPKPAELSSSELEGQVITVASFKQQKTWVHVFRGGTNDPAGTPHLLLGIWPVCDGLLSYCGNARLQVETVSQIESLI